MPIVSVIVPVYNVEKYLYKCVDSILVQTFSDLELILVDDGSPDLCPVICDEYARQDTRIKVIHRKNGGVSAARNSGLDAATGKYIAFCDSDDWWDPDFLSTHMRYMEQNHRDLVVSDYRAVNSSGEMIRTGKKLERTLLLKTEKDSVCYLYDIISLKLTGWEIYTRFFKNDIIQKNHIRFCETCQNYAEDLGFTLAYALYAKSIQYIPYCGYNYNLREGSMMDSSKHVIKLDQMNEVSKFLSEDFFACIQNETERRNWPMLHFFIMHNEYQKVLRDLQDPMEKLAESLKKIKNRIYFLNQTKALTRNIRVASARYGKKNAMHLYLFVKFCQHQKVKRYQNEKQLVHGFGNICRFCRGR